MCIIIYIIIELTCSLHNTSSMAVTCTYVARHTSVHAMTILIMTDIHVIILLFLTVHA